MNSRLKEEKFEAMLELALMEQMELEKPLLQPDGAGQEEYIFSRSFSRNIHRMIRNTRMKEISARRLRGTAVASIMILAGTTMVLNVDAFKTPVYNFVMEVKDKYTGIEFKPEEDEIVIPEELAMHMPEYAPEGFKLSSLKSGEDYSLLKYESGSQYYELHFADSDMSMMLDTEETDSEVIELEGRKIFFVEKGGKIQLSMIRNDKLYRIKGIVDKKEGVNILLSIN